MKKSIKIIIAIIFIFILMMIININKVNASSVELTASSTSVTEGTSVTVTATVTSGSWNLTLAGAGQSTKLVGGSAEVTGNTSSSKSITFTASQVGTYTFTLSGDMSDFYTDITEPVNKSITINVTAAPPQAPADTSGSSEESSNSSTPAPTTTKSSNANLSALSVSPGELSPAFSQSRKTYTVYVEADVEELKISASVAHSKAKYSVSGHRQLTEGENPAKLVVTAEDGTKNTYTINIIKAKSLNLKLATLELEGFTLTPEFNAEVYTYTINPEEFIESLIISATPQEEFTPIEITGNENLQEGENVITITLKSPDGTITQEYKIKVMNPAKVEELVEEVLGVTDENTEESEITLEDINRMKKQIAIRLFLIAILCAIVALITYYLVELYVKQKQQDEEDDDEYIGPQDEQQPQTEGEQPQQTENEENTQNQTEQQEQQSNFDIVDRRKYRRDSGRGKHF